MAEDRQGSLTELLGQIFSQASGDGLGSSNLPTASTSAVSDPAEPLRLLIRKAQARVQSMSLISSNDTLEDLPTPSIRTLLLNSVYAQVRSRGHTRPGDFSARIDILRQTKDAYLTFLGQLLAVNVLSLSSDIPYVKILSSQAQKAVNTEVSPIPEDATNRRASKIAAMKLERALTNALDTFRRAARAKLNSSVSIRSGSVAIGNGNGAAGLEAPQTAFDLLILPKQNEQQDAEDDEDDETAEDNFVRSAQSDENGLSVPQTLRSYLIMLCHLHAVMSLSALDSTFTELQLLQSMPPDAESQSQGRAAQEFDQTQRRQNRGENENSDWRLDRRWGVGNDSPILDTKGKPLRPFTILPGGQPSNAGARGMGTAQDQLDARRRLQAQVFQPGHRLPTMTIDEYLAEEERRGNIIKGGGQASADKLTTKETLALRAEGHNVSTEDAEEAEEQRRRKAIDWDDFAEANPKGVGNTMNRG